MIQVLNAINPGKNCSKLAQLLHKQFTFDKVFQGWGRRVLPKNLGGSCGTVLQALTLFQTKMCDFPTLFQRTLNLLHLRKHLRKASISQLKYLVLKTVPDQRAQEASHHFTPKCMDTIRQTKTAQKLTLRGRFAPPRHIRLVIGLITCEVRQ